MGKSGQVDRIGIGPFRPGQGIEGLDFLPGSVEKVDLDQGVLAQQAINRHGITGHWVWIGIGIDQSDAVNGDRRHRGRGHIGSPGGSRCERGGGRPREGRG